MQILVEIFSKYLHLKFYYMKITDMKKVNVWYVSVCVSHAVLLDTIIDIV